MISELRLVLLNASGPHLSAIRYLEHEARRWENQALTAKEKPKSIDAEQLSNSASCSMATIICSYALLEAQINEFVSWCQDATTGKSRVLDDIQVTCLRKATLVPGFERLETLKKFQEILRIADRLEFESDKEPFQSVDVLRRLRNFTVHLKSVDSKTFTGEAAKLRRALESRSISFHISRLAVYPDAFLSADCASWAAQTALGFVEAFIQRIEDG